MKTQASLHISADSTEPWHLLTQSRDVDEGSDNNLDLYALASLDTPAWAFIQKYLPICNRYQNLL